MNKKSAISIWCAAILCLLAAGCKPRPAEPATAPTSAQMSATTAPEPEAPPADSEPMAEVLDDSWIERQTRKETLLRELRERAAAAPDDPLAPSQEGIEALADQDSPAIL